MTKIKNSFDTAHCEKCLSDLDLFKFLKMKILFFIFAIIIGAATTSCNDIREKTAEELLESPKMEEEIYSAILSDSLYFTLFMNKMMSNENSKKMLTENYPMMKMMCLSKEMDNLINSDQQARESMSNRFMLKMEAKSAVCDKTCVKYLPSEHLQKCIKGQMCEP